MTRKRNFNCRGVPTSMFPICIVGPEMSICISSKNRKALGNLTLIKEDFEEKTEFGEDLIIKTQYWRERIARSCSSGDYK